MSAPNRKPPPAAAMNPPPPEAGGPPAPSVTVASALQNLEETMYESPDEDYMTFVKAVTTNDNQPFVGDETTRAFLEDDEEEYVMEEDDEEDPFGLDGLEPLDMDDNSSLPGNFYAELEQELGNLQEEDERAAVATLLDQQMEEPPPLPTEATTTPLRDVVRSHSRVQMSEEQSEKLSSLFQLYFQLLVQQAVLTTRALHKPKGQEKLYGDTTEELNQLLEGSQGMLKDLYNNRKDAIRYNLLQAKNSDSVQRSLFDNNRLTRSQFNASLQQVDSVSTIFDIAGLQSLHGIFRLLDPKQAQEGGGTNQTVCDLDSDAAACDLVFDASKAKIDQALVPGGRDLSETLTLPTEILKDFKPPCSNEQVTMLRRSRTMYTAGEDNLVLRGVNLYGEKQWMLITERFMPERSMNSISQRFSKLQYMLFKSRGVYIDNKGSLAPPPKLESVDDINEAALANIQPVDPPAILNVHRWSTEEDLLLLKLVPIMGTMWAELRARFIPHRDRGHLRKRYQVLERRIKATHGRVVKLHKSAPKFRHVPKMFDAAGITNAVQLTNAVIPLPAEKPKPPPKAATEKKKVGKTGYAAPVPDAYPPHPPYMYPPYPYPGYPPMFYYPHPHAYPHPPTNGAAPSAAPTAAKPAAGVAQAAPVAAPPAAAALPQDESSRMAFENLLTDPGSAWPTGSLWTSKENETESMVANTMTELAKGPAKVIAGYKGSPEKTVLPESPPRASAESDKTFHSPSVGAIHGFSPKGLDPADGLLLGGYGPDGGSPFVYRPSEFNLGGGNSMSGYDNPLKTNLFGEGATLLENDLEAITALNSLSQSPAKPTEAPDHDSKPEATKRKSLFASVVEGTKDLASKKRKG